MNQISPRQPDVMPAEQGQLPPPDPNQERRRRHMAQWFGLTAVAALAGAGAWGEAERRAETIATLNIERDAVPVVRTEVVKLLGTPPPIELTGSTQAFDAATLFARATGYISKRSVDIGSRVNAGNVLAVIAAPDLDQQGP